MWALPAMELKRGDFDGCSIQNILKNCYQIKINQKPVLIGEVNHAFTHRIWLMKLYHCELNKIAFRNEKVIK